MALDPDVVLDRRHLKRRVSFWRTAAIIVAAVLAYVLAAGETDEVFRRDHVAFLDISGLIIGDDETLQALEEVAEDDRTRALIVYVDSPGGTTYGGEALF